jgi:hypothetical protein
MKKLILSLMLGIVLLGVISACGYNDNHDCDVHSQTYVKGKVTYADTDDEVGKALVTVTCFHEGTEYTKTTWTVKYGALKGTYFVIFPQTQCADGDEVKVVASKNGLTGENDGEVIDWITQKCLDIDIAIIDVPLVPEFGTSILILTALGAVTIFFVVRRK